MSDIMISVDTSQVKSAKQEMQELGSSVNSAINSASVFAKAFNASLGAAFREADRGPALFREIARANQEVINSLQGVTNTYLSAEQSASVFTEELRKQEAQTLKTARANQEAINTQLGVSNKYLSAEQSASVFTEELRKQEAQAVKTARANQEAINSLQGVTNTYLSAEQSASVFTEELRKQEAQAQKTARANQDAINKQLGVNKPSATSGGAGYGALEAEMLRLETMYNKVALAARVYEQAQESLNSAVLMGVLTADQKEAKLGELSLAYQKVGNDADKAQAFINRFGENAQVTGRGLNRFGMIAQQVGYQVGDFFVQIQSGTNFLVAFGQQATQLAGLIPGAWGAAIGIGISLATAIGAAFMRSGEAAKEAAGGVTTYADAIKALTEDIKSAREEFLKLRFGTDSLGVAGAKQQLQDLEDKLRGLIPIRDRLLKAGGQAAARVGLLGIDELEAEKAALEENLAVLQEIETSQNYLAASQKRASREPSAPYKEEAAYAKMIAEEEAKAAALARSKKDAFHAMAGEMTSVSSSMEGLNANAEKLKGQLTQTEQLARLKKDAFHAMAGELGAVSSSMKGLNADAEKLKDTLTQAEELARLKKNAFHAMAGEMGAVSSAALETLNAQEAINAALSAGDVDSFNKAMNEALEAGVRFSQTDLSSVVAFAAKHGWSLAASLQAAWAAVDGGNIVNANPSMGPGFEGGGRNRDQIVQATYQPTFSELLANQSKKGGGGDKKDPLEELRKQIELENELLGVSEAQARVIQALGMDRSKYSQVEINAITAEIEAYNQKQETIERTKEIMDTVKSSMEDAFMSMVDGTKSAKDAFKSMAAEIIKELYRVLVVQQLVNGISGAIGGIFGGSAAPISSPRPMANPFLQTRASGGPISANTPYLVGEKGPELVIPRHSGTVVNAAQTAQAMGSGSGDVTVQNNITVTGSDAAMVRTEIAKMIPQITNATKAAVIDAKQRGGQMAAAFR